MQVRIIVGDWSLDGHSYTDTYDVEVNIQSDYKDLNFFYKLAIEDGVPDIKEWFSRVGQCTVSEDEIFELSNFIEIHPDDYDPAGGRVYITPDDYANMWIDIVNYGISISGVEGSVEIIESVGKVYNIGGYGLYE